MVKYTAREAGVCPCLGGKPRGHDPALSPQKNGIGIGDEEPVQS